jgi:hypothetical protein
VLSGSLPVERDAPTAVDELTALQAGAQRESLEPADGEDREPVVQLGDVDVRGPQ